MKELKCEKPIEVIPNGVDIDAFYPRNNAKSKREIRVLFSVTRRDGKARIGFRK